MVCQRSARGKAGLMPSRKNYLGGLLRRAVDHVYSKVSSHSTHIKTQTTSTSADRSSADVENQRHVASTAEISSASDLRKALTARWMGFIGWLALSVAGVMGAVGVWMELEGLLWLSLLLYSAAIAKLVWGLARITRGGND